MCSEVMVEGALGGFVEFFGIEGFVGGCGLVFGNIGRRIGHWCKSLELMKFFSGFGLAHPVADFAATSKGYR